MKQHSLLSLTIAALLTSAAFAQKPGEKPLSETDLLKQIETLTPSKPAAKPASAKNGGPVTLFDPARASEAVRAGEELRSDKRPKEKKSKGPTEITANEATFDQKANLAIFIGAVVVKDPEFNVSCDKLTAYLKSDPKTKPTAEAAAKPAPPKTDEAPAKKKGGGLEKAVAESTGEQRVIITQEKTEADGTISRSIGKADKATYDAASGDIVLYGTPEVLQNINKVIATDPGTIMTLNRDGRMKASGPHKTTITEKGDGF